MKFSTVEKFALGLPEVTREPHFHLDSFRVRGRIFVTADTDAGFIRVFVPDEVREPALAKYPSFLEKLHWGKKVVGLQITLSAAAPGVVKALVKAAWLARAPAALARRLK